MAGGAENRKTPSNTGGCDNALFSQLILDKRRLPHLLKQRRLVADSIETAYRIIAAHRRGDALIAV
jgi:hypothetical protein